MNENVMDEISGKANLLSFTIADLKRSHTNRIRQVAEILQAAFHETAPEAWPTFEEAWKEVQESLEPGRISRVALDLKYRVLGWIGGIESYEGRVWELHPLVVDPKVQGYGIGQALALDFEEQVRQRGGLTITLGTDDTVGRTSLFGADLYKNLWDQVQQIRNLKRHPYEFYQKLGYTITGVLPDANGPGKPDILMSKHV